MSALAPRLAPQQRVTYSILRPANEAGAGTFWREVDCAGYGCRAHELGWTTTLDPATHPAQVQYIRRESGRRFIEATHPDGRISFAFEPGQRCFRAHEHRLPVEREPLYLVRGGDSRLWTGQRRLHSSAEAWRDDFGEHQQTLRDAQQKG